MAFEFDEDTATLAVGAVAIGAGLWFLLKGQGGAGGGAPCEAPVGAVVQPVPTTSERTFYNLFAQPVTVGPESTACIMPAGSLVKVMGPAVPGNVPGSTDIPSPGLAAYAFYQQVQPLSGPCAGQSLYIWIGNLQGCPAGARL